METFVEQPQNNVSLPTDKAPRTSPSMSESERRHQNNIKTKNALSVSRTASTTHRLLQEAWCGFSGPSSLNPARPFKQALSSPSHQVKDFKGNACDSFFGLCGCFRGLSAITASQCVWTETAFPSCSGISSIRLYQSQTHFRRHLRSLAEQSCYHIFRRKS